MLKRLRERLPKSKTPEEISEHYRQIEAIGLEKGDFTAMLIAAVLSIGLPVALISAMLYTIIYLIFVC